MELYMELQVTATWPVIARTMLLVKVAFCPNPVTKSPEVLSTALFPAIVLLIKIGCEPELLGETQIPPPL
jgi:hypothetical protein